MGGPRGAGSTLAASVDCATCCIGVQFLFASVHIFFDWFQVGDLESFGHVRVVPSVVGVSGVPSPSDVAGASVVKGGQQLHLPVRQAPSLGAKQQHTLNDGLVEGGHRFGVSTLAR